MINIFNGQYVGDDKKDDRRWRIDVGKSFKELDVNLEKKELGRRLRK